MVFGCMRDCSLIRGASPPTLRPTARTALGFRRSLRRCSSPVSWRASGPARRGRSAAGRFRAPLPGRRPRPAGGRADDAGERPQHRHRRGAASRPPAASSWRPPGGSTRCVARSDADEYRGPRVADSSSQESRTAVEHLGVRTRSSAPACPSSPERRADAHARTSTAGAAPVNHGTVTFRLRQPLLRGRGRAAVAAGELAAEREVAASGFDLRQTVAQRVLTVASQYWMTGAAVRNLEVLRASEDELARAAGEHPQADRGGLSCRPPSWCNWRPTWCPRSRPASAASASCSRRARIWGGRSASMPERDRGPAPPRRSRSRPRVRTRCHSARRRRRFVAEALARRADLRAARERRRSLEILRRAAAERLEAAARPGGRAHLSGRLDGSDAGGFFSPLFRNVPGAWRHRRRCSLSWPPATIAPRASSCRRRAARRQSDLIVELLAKGDRSGRAGGARRRGAQHPAARQGAARRCACSSATVINEEKKLRAGSSTLLDVISQRDRLTSARQAEVSARARPGPLPPRAPLPRPGPCCGDASD